MKKVFLSLLSLLSLVSISAQEIVVGDMDGDGNVTVKDVTECANTVIGKSAVKTISAKTIADPNASDFTSLAGTWRSITGVQITLDEDGKATHSDLQTVKAYEYYPYRGNLVFLNSGNYVVEVYDVIRIGASYVVLCEHGTKNYICYYTDQSFVSGITLSETSLALNTGMSKQLTATITPSAAIVPLLKWTSSDESVATVDQTGKVTGVNGGSCVITATATDGTGMSADCSVTVKQLVSSITLSETTLNLDIDGYTKLTATISPSSVSNTSVTWSSSDENVAEVSSKGVVSVNGYGRCVITCTANDGSGVSASCSVIVEKPHEYVDLGLSVKWATMNVGATEVAGSKKNSHTGQLDCYGEYYAWGETSPKDSYSWSNLKYCTSYDTDNWEFTFSKYVASSSYGTVDNKTTLELSDDAASANWGGSWRMPTLAEQQELLNNCYWEWTTSYNNSGVKGYIVYKVKNDSDKGKKKYSGSSTATSASYSLSDTHIFLPAAGYRYDSSFYYVGSYGYYWSSSLYTDYSNNAYVLSFSSDYVDWGVNGRYRGQCVRPVCP